MYVNTPLGRNQKFLLKNRSLLRVSYRIFEKAKQKKAKISPFSAFFRKTIDFF
jgi:hypothetical protein